MHGNSNIKISIVSLFTLFSSISKFFLLILKCLHKITKSVFNLRHACRSVLPPARPPAFNKPSERIFHEIWYFKTSRNFVKEIQITLKYEKKNNWFFTWRCIYIYGNCEQCFRQTFWKKPHIIQVKALSPKSCALRNNEGKYGTAREATDINIIRRMRIACWKPKATNTHTEYIIFIAFLPQKQLQC